MDRVRNPHTFRIEVIKMRESNREKILDGVVRLIERDGVTAITFDAVAAETGITRGGIIYHFSSREELILATHQHLARQWEAQMRSLTPDPDLPADRYRAYVQSCSRDATRAELLMMLESAGDERLVQVWSEVIDRWAPPAPQSDDPVGLTHFLARIAADGLWAHRTMTGRPLPPEVKAKVSGSIIKLIGQ
jgi:AcrR family transcriptional regulator